MAPTAIADYTWLVSDCGREWLERCSADTRPLHERARWLRGRLTSGQTHCVLEQLRLRQRAGRKFPAAARMFFLDRPLQQATDWNVASYKASRFPTGGTVTDLCCGIGGDLLALGQRGPVQGVELDAIATLLARANARALQLALVHVAQGDVAQLCVLRDAAIHLDPDRRPLQQRTTELVWSSPGPDTVAQWFEHPAGLALKLAPACAPTDRPLPVTELEWIGHRRECQQLVAWYGPLARHPGCRVATVLAKGGTAHTLVEDARAQLVPTVELSRYVIEPEASVLAAGLAGTFAERFGLRSLTAQGGYLTGTSAEPSAWASRYEVLDHMPFRPRNLAPLLRRYGIGTLEVKKRGVELDPLALQRTLSRPEGTPATLFVLRFGRKQVAVLTRRVS